MADTTVTATVVTSQSKGASESEVIRKNKKEQQNEKNNNKNNDNNNKNTEDDPTSEIEYNPRWMGYSYIIISSLVNFCAVSSVPDEQRATFWYMSIAFGVLTFIISSLIVIQDWTQKWIQSCMGTNFNFVKAKDGYLEGYVLIFLLLWNVCGVAYLTRPGGIAYVASNIYYSAWLAFISCGYTLNEWSASKDILSIEEITSISPTLKYWWILFLSACIVFGSCLDVMIRYHEPWDDFDDSTFGLALGLVSMAISLLYILIHYDFLTACECEEGGWAELFTSCFLILVWVIGLSILTQEGAVAATMSGNQCLRNPANIVPLELNCSVVVNQQSYPCNDIPQQTPGSNLYFASWLCTLSSMAVALEWKAAQALKFAQAQAERQQRKEQEEQDVGSDDDDDENENN